MALPRHALTLALAAALAAGSSGAVLGAPPASKAPPVKAKAAPPKAKAAPPKARATKPGSHGVLALSVGETPGVPAPPDLIARLGQQLDAAFRTAAGDRYTFEVPSEAKAKATKAKKGPKGYRLRGTIAELRVEEDPAAGHKVSILVRVTVSTWPEGHLRWILSAKASAAAKAPPDTVEAAALEAAISDVVRDVMKEIDKAKR